MRFVYFLLFTAAVLAATLSFSSLLKADDGDRIILTAEQIAEMKANKIADVFNHLPGVTASDSSVNIHGSSKVKVFLDGVPLNDPTASHGSINWSHVPVDSIEKIEILKDSGGLRYGQDASGGVVLISSKNIGAWSGNIKAYGGTDELAHVDFNVNTRKGLWGFGLKGGYERDNGYKINNDKRKWQSGFKSTYNPSQSRYLSLSFDVLDEKKGLSGQPDFPTPFSRQRTRNYYSGLSGRYDNISNNFYYNSGRVDNDDFSRSIDNSLKVEEMGDDLTYDLQTGSWGSLTLGTGFKYGQASSSSFDTVSEHTLYLFASQKIKLGSWTFKVGARGNLNSDFENSFNPEGSVSYEGRNWKAAFIYSRANNTPSFQQRYNHTSSTIPSPDLGVEKSDNFSLSLSFQPTDNLNLSATAFYNRLTDRISYERSLVTGIGQYDNVGRVTYKGVDLAASWKASKILTFKGSYTYLDARDEDLNRWITAKPRQRFNLEAYINPTEKWSNVLSLSYTGELYNDRANTKRQASSSIVDLRSEYDFGSWSIFAEIDNVFDKYYYYGDGLLAPPRICIIGLNWDI